jgi:NifU-like protein involved in Fe-S cluster formation
MGRFSSTLQEHFSAPRNVGPLDGATVVVTATRNGRPPRLTLHLKVEDQRVVDAAFNAFGCGVAIACGSVLTEQLIGRSIADCQLLTQDDLLEAIDGVPRNKQFCAAIAMDALRMALGGLDDDSDRSRATMN